MITVYHADSGCLQCKVCDRYLELSPRVKVRADQVADAHQKFEDFHADLHHKAAKADREVKPYLVAASH